MSCVGAVPLTVVVTLSGDVWAASMQAIVQLVQTTYSSGVAQIEAGVPVKVPVHLAPTEGVCPFSELSNT
eukprot:10727007-Lingulodinium_polyedra.AAC.1